MVDANGYAVEFRVEKLEKIRRTHKIPRIFWSECRDSNSRPLEPHFHSRSGIAYLLGANSGI